MDVYKASPRKRTLSVVILSAPHFGAGLGMAASVAPPPHSAQARAAPNHCKLKSHHAGLRETIKAIFLTRSHRLISFSRSIALCTSSIRREIHEPVQFVVGRKLRPDPKLAPPHSGDEIARGPGVKRFRAVPNDVGGVPFETRAYQNDICPQPSLSQINLSFRGKQNPCPPEAAFSPRKDLNVFLCTPVASARPSDREMLNSSVCRRDLACNISPATIPNAVRLKQAAVPTAEEVPSCAVFFQSVSHS